jgi:hypothetical protein
MSDHVPPQYDTIMAGSFRCERCIGKDTVCLMHEPGKACWPCAKAKAPCSMSIKKFTGRKGE